MPIEISVVFNNGSNYDYQFIIKELAKKLEGQFECLGENTENYKTFSIPIEKGIKNIDKDGNESVDSARFVVSSLTNLVDNLTEEIHKIKCQKELHVQS